MRRPLTAAAVAALALVPSSSAHAVGVGAGAVVIPASSFFRPNVGVAGVGSCIYAEAVLVAAVAGVAVTGVVATVSVSCTVQDSAGATLLSAGASSSLNAGVGYRTGLPVNTPVRICGTVTVDSPQWGPATASSCAAVLPGNPK